MTQPGSIANAVPAGDDYLARRLRDLERRVAEMSSTLQARALIEQSSMAFSPVDADAISDYETSFALTTAQVAKESYSLTGLASNGYNRIIVMASAQATVLNSRTAAGLLNVRVNIGGEAGLQTTAQAAANTYANATALGTATFGADGVTLPDTLTLSIEAWCDTGTWSANANNFASLSAIIVYLKAR